MITGAGSGIGRACCQVFAREGAALAAVDLNLDSVNKTLETVPKGRDLECCSFCLITSVSGFALALKKLSPSLSPNEKSWGQLRDSWGQILRSWGQMNNR